MFNLHQKIDLVNYKKTFIELVFFRTNDVKNLILQDIADKYIGNYASINISKCSLFSST